MPADPDLPLVLTTADARRYGLSRHQVTRRLRTGRWVQLRRGVYGIRAALEELTPREQHIAAVYALLLTRPDDDVASHLSAAALHGWLLPLAGAGPPTVTAPSLSVPTRRRHGHIVQVAGLPTQDLTWVTVQLAGRPLRLPCTQPARTLADLLRHLPMPEAVAIGDHAIRCGDVSHEDLARVVTRQEGWPYATRAHQAFPVLDPRRESWLESYSFVVLHQNGLPWPEPQVDVHDRRGRFVARVDGWYDDAAVALEADGKGKYLSGLGALSADVDQAAEEVATTVRDHLLRQQVRQRRLEDIGVQVVRWSTAEVTGRAWQVADRVRYTCRRAQAGGFSGSVVRRPAPSWFAQGEAA